MSFVFVSDSERRHAPKALYSFLTLQVVFLLKKKAEVLLYLVINAPISKAKMCYNRIYLVSVVSVK